MPMISNSVCHGSHSMRRACRCGRSSLWKWNVFPVRRIALTGGTPLNLSKRAMIAMSGGWMVVRAVLCELVSGVFSLRNGNLQGFLIDFGVCGRCFRAYALEIANEFSFA